MEKLVEHWLYLGFFFNPKNLVGKCMYISWFQTNQQSVVFDVVNVVLFIYNSEEQNQFHNLALSVGIPHQADRLACRMSTSV